MFLRSDEDIQQEAKQIARKTTDDPTMQKYVEGASYKIIKLEEKVEKLTTNFWLLIIIIFVLPIFFRS